MFFKLGVVILVLNSYMHIASSAVSSEVSGEIELAASSCVLSYITLHLMFVIYGGVEGNMDGVTIVAVVDRNMEVN